jgi:DNA polymerase II large subunit
MLALDALLNFSRTFLPEQSGGLMDAPLLIIPNINPREVDKEAHNLDVNPIYPLKFYELSKKNAKPSEYGTLLDTLGSRLSTINQYQEFNYTEKCRDINLGGRKGAYTSLSTMIDKLNSQLDLTKKLVSVDEKVVALKILNSHFMKDIIGNLRAFTSQKFRCTKCNRKYRRPPLTGVCKRCGEGIVLTVHKGSIEKYLQTAINLVENYKLGKYYEDRLNLVKEEINSIFVEEDKEEPSHQFNLTDFMTRKR